jgi:hypothetical protein
MRVLSWRAARICFSAIKSAAIPRAVKTMGTYGSPFRSSSEVSIRNINREDVVDQRHLYAMRLVDANVLGELFFEPVSFGLEPVATDIIADCVRA